jgi:hypothetical protein
LFIRAASSLLGIIAILIGLMTGPFFHIHSEGDNSHGHNDAAELHSHFIDVLSDHHSEDSQELEISADHSRHHSIGVSVLAASARRVQVFVAELQTSKKIAEPSGLPGYGTKIPVRVHDPPALGKSNPRSPPA